ncbi:MAG: UPF0149 family protein [Gammaproteobacteria bacterium]
MMNIPSYEDIKSALSTVHNLVTPAELHGILCGLICAGLNKLDAKDVPETLMLELPEHLDTSTINNTLNMLFNNTQDQIKHFELDFQLLLPDDDTPLDERAYEFGKWCEGFIVGIGLSDAPHSYRDQREVGDILYKLNEAAKIQFEHLDFTEEDEHIFMEVTEFVRLAVFAIYQELSDDSGDSKHIPHNETLH